MSQNIKLNDGEIALVIDNASIIMNVNTAFEIVEKLFGGDGCDCPDENAEVKDTNKNDNKSEDVMTDNFDTLIKVADKKPVVADLFANVPEIKSSTCVGGKDKVPVLVFEFDTKRAEQFNDLRAGVGKCIKRFDSMAGVDCYYYATPGTASAVANTWLPYCNHTGAMNPMIGDKKNYRFSSKYNGKPLRWSFVPYEFPKYGTRRLVVFRADAIPQFILDRYTKKNS